MAVPGRLACRRLLGSGHASDTGAELCDLTLCLVLPIVPVLAQQRCNFGSHHLTVPLLPVIVGRAENAEGSDEAVSNPELLPERPVACDRRVQGMEA